MSSLQKVGLLCHFGKQLSLNNQRNNKRTKYVNYTFNWVGIYLTCSLGLSGPFACLSGSGIHPTCLLGICGLIRCFLGLEYTLHVIWAFVAIYMLVGPSRLKTYTKRFSLRYISVIHYSRKSNEGAVETEHSVVPI